MSQQKRTVLRIRDVYLGSGISDPTFSIPNPELTSSQIRIYIKELKYFWPKKLILNGTSQNKDPECSSKIPGPGSGFFFHPGSRRQKLHGIPYPYPQHWKNRYFREKDKGAAAHLHKISDQLKILSLSSCVVNGPYSGKRAFFQTSSAYVWGHHLARANLMYNIRAGDMFRVEVICTCILFVLQLLYSFFCVTDPDLDSSRQ